MPKKTQGQMIQETHQGMFGVPGTDDKGLVGNVKEFKRDFREQNSQVRRNSKLIYIIIGVLVTVGAIGSLEAADVIRLLGG